MRKQNFKKFGWNVMNKAYGLRCKDEETLIKSSSGGAFSVISDFVLNNDGFVFGAIYNYDTNCVQHIGTNKNVERNWMRGSKYIQSEMGDCFYQVKDLLKNGHDVFFTGTICQISGLKKYLSCLNVSTDGLLTCDIICHGAGSPKVWKEYISHKLKLINKSKFDKVSFRDKSDGWGSSHTIAIYGDQSLELPEFMKLYYGHTIMREACYSCEFAKIERESDITIGDFWGIESSHPSHFHSNGVSFVMVNSVKGHDVMEVILNDETVEVFECDINDTVQPNLYKPTYKSVLKRRVVRDFQNKGIEYVLDEYTSDRKLVKLRINTKKMIDKFTSVLEKFMYKLKE